MTFLEQGFLYDKPISWSKETHPDFNDWFSLVDTLNNVAVKATFEAKPSTSNSKELLTAVLFIRTLQSFEGAILLAKRGMLTDARALIRIGTESTIAMGGVAKVEGFIDKLIQDHHKHQKTMTNSYLNSPESYAMLSSDQISNFKELLADIKVQYPNDELAKINWEEIANKSGLSALYNTVYRESSSTGAHTTIDCLNSYVNADGNGNIVGLNFGPKTDEMISTLSSAINTLMFAGLLFFNAFNLSAFELEWRSCLAKWQELMKIANETT